MDLISWHSRLLNDNVRMQVYRQAIFKTVKPGDVVLDVGTGSGIMAMFACQAGARRVYAVELEDIIFTARQLAKENGFSDRIVFLHEDVRDIRLDEKVDVIISELISDNGPGENMAELVNLCRDRFLRPHGKIVPQRVDTYIAPLEDVEAFRMVQLPDKSAYGINFSSYEQRIRDLAIRSYTSGKVLLASGQTAYSYDALASSSPDRFDASLIFQVKRRGIMHGYCSWFVAILTEGVELSNKPPEKLCWSTIFLPLARPVPVAPGMAIELNFRGRYDSQINYSSEWDTTIRKGDRIIANHRQSCVLDGGKHALSPQSLSSTNMSATRNMNLSKYCIRFHHPEDHGLITLFSTRTMSVVDVTPEVIRDIEKGDLPDKERKTLRSEGFLVENAGEEKQEMLRYFDDLNAENEAFNAIVVLNLDCNLACKYCFEGGRKGKFYMSEETADRLVDFIKSGLHGKAEINIVFYGGEPLLSMNLIVHISKQLRTLAKNKRLKYSFSFITNGTLLTSQSVKKLKPLGLRSASVTLDGPRGVHDMFRPFKSGSDSFAAIIKNIKNACRLIDVQIGGNYTRDHYREFPRLLDYFLESGITPSRISYVRFDPVINESKEFAPPDFHDGCMSINEPWLVEASLFLREEILRRGFRTQELAPGVCMMEVRDNLVVNYDGTLYKCPGLIGRKDCRVGDLKTGLTDYRVSHNLDNWKNEECLACSYLPLCFGGCRYMKLLKDGTMKGINCRKEYFDKTLESFVSQDVRYDNENRS